MESQDKIKFMYDQEGKETDVVIPIELFEEELEDFFDIRAIKERKKEKERIPFEEVEKRFKEKHA